MLAWVRKRTVLDLNPACLDLAGRFAPARRRKKILNVPSWLSATWVHNQQAWKSLKTKRVLIRLEQKLILNKKLAQVAHKLKKGSASRLRSLKLLPKLSLRKDKMKSGWSSQRLALAAGCSCEVQRAAKTLAELVVSIRLMRSLRGSINHKTKRNFITAG